MLGWGTAYAMTQRSCVDSFRTCVLGHALLLLLGGNKTTHRLARALANPLQEEDRFKGSVRGAKAMGTVPPIHGAAILAVCRI